MLYFYNLLKSFKNILFDLSGVHKLHPIISNSLLLFFNHNSIFICIYFSFYLFKLNLQWNKKTNAHITPTCCRTLTFNRHNNDIKTRTRLLMCTSKSNNQTIFSLQNGGCLKPDEVRKVQKLNCVVLFLSSSLSVCVRCLERRNTTTAS